MKTKILYFSYSRIPSYTANSIAVMNFCQALSEEVDLRVVCIKNSKIKNISYQDFYGVDLPHIILIPEWFMRRNGILYKLFAMLYAIFCKANMVYSRDIIISEALARINIRSIYEIHQIVQECESFSVEFDRSLRYLLNKNKLYKLICISEELKEECISYGFDKDKIKVLTSGVREDFFIGKREIGKNLNYNIMYIGSLQKGKGISTILKIAKLMPEDKFLIIGGNVKELGSTPDNLEHIPWVMPKDVLTFLKEADIVLVPFDVQQYKFYSPLKLFEYMAAGKIVLASDIQGINGIIKDRYNGFLAKPGDVDDFCSKINFIKNNPQLVEKVQDNAVSFARLHTWSERAKMVKCLVEDDICHDD